MPRRLRTLSTGPGLHCWATGRAQQAPGPRTVRQCHGHQVEADRARPEQIQRAADYVELVWLARLIGEFGALLLADYIRSCV